MTALTRPILRYHGGKWRLAPWIIGHFPQHKIYVEPFGGAASVLLRKRRAYAEVYNDLDGEIVNLFRVLRDPEQAHKLTKMVELTPYARVEFENSYIKSDNPIEQARRTLFRFAAGHSTSSQRRYATGFRSNVTRSNSTPAHNWSTLPGVFSSVTNRLRGVVIECMPALDVIATYDNREALFYCDPPYVNETRNARSAGDVYAFEMTDDDHRDLAAVLHGVAGHVVISGYACELYDRELYADWHRVERQALADSRRRRVEVLWIKPGSAVQRRLL